MPNSPSSKSHLAPSCSWTSVKLPDRALLESPGVLALRESHGRAGGARLRMFNFRFQEAQTCSSARGTPTLGQLPRWHGQGGLKKRFWTARGRKAPAQA